MSNEGLEMSANEIVQNILEQKSEEERAREEMVAELMKFRVSVKDEFPPEQCVVVCGDVPFFAKGDIHAIKAKQKQGKTTAISIMVAAILCGQWGKLKAAMDNAKVLFIDTEQKAADSQLIYNRTLALAGLPKEDIYDRLQMFCLRSLTRQEKLKAVIALVRELKPDIVFIDGVVDLMGNFNEVDDSMNIINELMRLSTKEVSGVEVAVVCVLHTNKSSDDHNMRGHAGTMLAQKAGVVLEVTKKDGIFTISNSDSRHREVPVWAYRYDEQDNIVDATEEHLEMIENEKAQKAENAQQRKESIKEERRQKLISIVERYPFGIHRNELKKHLEIALRLGRSSLDTIIRECLNERLIVEKNKNMYIVPSQTNNETPTQEEISFN